MRARECAHLRFAEVPMYLGLCRRSIYITATKARWTITVQRMKVLDREPPAGQRLGIAVDDTDTLAPHIDNGVHRQLPDLANKSLLQGGALTKAFDNRVGAVDGSLVHIGWIGASAANVFITVQLRFDISLNRRMCQNSLIDFIETVAIDIEPVEISVKEQADLATIALLSLLHRQDFVQRLDVSVEPTDDEKRFGTELGLATKYGWRIAVTQRTAPSWSRRHGIVYIYRHSFRQKTRNSRRHDATCVHLDDRVK